MEVDMFDPPSELALLAKQCEEDSARWFPGRTEHNLPFYVLALAGEVGELANVVKKIERGSLNPKDAAVKRMLDMEATDVLIYLLNIFAVLGVDPLKSYNNVRQLNEQRFGRPAVRTAPSRTVQSG
jgi:NTP pyrophosphatase (non-canonical NTP hydrolase)